MTTTSAPTSPRTTSRFIVTPNRSSTTTAVGDGQRDRDQGNHRRAPGEQEQTDQQDRPARPIEQREPEVAHRGLDEGGRAVHGGIDPHVAQTRGRSRSAASTPLVTSRVFASGNFSTTSIRPLPSSTMPSPMSSWWSSTTWATSPRRRPGVALDRDLGKRVRVHDRRDVLHGHPLVRGVDEPAGARGRGLQERQRGDPRRVAGRPDDVDQVTPLACSAAGSTWTCSWRSRSPNTDTFDTPGTPISRGRMVQRVSTDWSMSDCVGDDSPSTMARLADETGSIITGGLDTLGRACGLRHPFGDQLPRPVQVRARLEDHHDRRQPRHRVGSDLVEERDAVEQVRLQRDRDQLLDFRRRQTQRLGLDLDVGRAELG